MHLDRSFNSSWPCGLRGPSLAELFSHLDDLPAVAQAASVSAMQPSRQAVEARPYQAAQLLKTALWRSQRRILRPIFERMRVGTREIDQRPQQTSENGF
eukprot:931638-Amphidinium_carterae.2